MHRRCYVDFVNVCMLSTITASISIGILQFALILALQHDHALLVVKLSQHTLACASPNDRVQLRRGPMAMCTLKRMVYREPLYGSRSSECRGHACCILCSRLGGRTRSVLSSLLRPVMSLEQDGCTHQQSLGLFILRLCASCPAYAQVLVHEIDVADAAIHHAHGFT